METLTITPEIVRLVDQMAADYRANLPVASGNLKNFTYGCEFNGSLFEVYFNLPEYWKYVENGRKAGKMPPIDAIKRWMLVKPVVPKAGKNGKIPTPNQTAYLIARSIGEKGIPAGHQLSDTLQKDSSIINQLEQLIINQLENDLGNI